MSRKNPFRDIERFFEQMERQFEESARRWDQSPFELGSTGGGSISVDVADNDAEFEVTADLPGFDKEDIEVTLSGDELTIRAEHEEDVEADEENYLRRERSRRSMRRSIRLPEPVNEEGITARYHNGVLTVTLPKIEPAEEGRSIDIE